MKIPGTHPALAGHFPGNPVVPGVVIIDQVVSAISDKKGRSVVIKSIPFIKFLNPVGPDQDFDIRLVEKESGKVDFSVYSGEIKVLTGSLVCS